ncbi:MAG TPA: isocitrate lyase/PEP mutase family protein [Methylomirabilota bacterium]|nr:isocitrate lyase/PEP mutase family protein [Methylomirabilota bacterium]
MRGPAGPGAAGEPRGAGSPRPRGRNAGGPSAARPRTPRQRLRRLVEARQALVVPGAYDALSARLVERAGFPAVYMTGFGVSAARLGLPDLGFAGLGEMVDQARNMASAVRIPVIADADTGYGNALQVRRTVEQYERAGVAALHLEDQVAPKRCGHLAGKQVVPADEFVGRVRAAVEARTDPDLLIIARTDAIAVTGFDDAVRRAEAAARAGADVLFVEAPTSEAEIAALPRRLDRPLLFNYAPSGRTPLPPFGRLRELGYGLVILPVDLLFAATRAMERLLAQIRERGAASRDPERLVSFQEFLTLIGLPEQMALAARY